MRLLLVDNYDSFTWNLAAAFEALGAEVEVVRNDRVTVDAAVARAPDRVVISPGPGRPEHAGNSPALLAAFLGRVPLLGVCLGHQLLVQQLGGRIVHAPAPVHGWSSPVRHDGRGLFRGLPQPVEMGRYHSLVADPATLPAGLEPCAWTADGVLMAVRHRTLPAWGVQFHPESVLSPQGPALLARFLDPALASGAETPPCAPARPSPTA